MDGIVANGFPCWVDLSTTDLAGGAAFYRELLGWTTTTIESPMGRYVVGSVGDREVAGMMAQPPEAAGSPSMWTMFVYAARLDDTLAAIESAGGNVLTPPFEIPNGAHVSVVTDVGGTMFALISARTQPGPYVSMTTGAVGWVELMTRCPEAAVAFYHEAFGWDAATDDVGITLYTTFSLDGGEVAGMIPTPDDLPDNVPDTWSVYFNVDDCAAAVETATELGGKVIVPPTTTPVGPFAVLADPQGAVFEIMEFAMMGSASTSPGG